MDEVKRKAIETLKLVSTDVISTAMGVALIDLGASRDSVTVTTIIGSSWIRLRITSDFRTGPYRSRTRIFNISLTEQQDVKGE